MALAQLLFQNGQVFNLQGETISIGKAKDSKLFRRLVVVRVENALLLDPSLYSPLQGVEVILQWDQKNKVYRITSYSSLVTKYNNHTLKKNQQAYLENKTKISFAGLVEFQIIY